ncbi:hypothetical protein [Sorangium sp. So ce1151]|uniref:hypothetical protein n=1 Tax=Sorangium sp. So ce1151 TaxID=3133332 RepID=UPI003F62DF12
MASGTSVLALGCALELSVPGATGTGGAGDIGAASTAASGSDGASVGVGSGGTASVGVGGSDAASTSAGEGGGGGAASASAASGGGCADGSTACSGACVDPGADPANCGACGNARAAGASCCDGTCADLSSDGLHCGACGHGCQGGPCSDAACQPVVLAEAAGNPLAIAVDATHVYWTHEDTGEIMRAPIAGGAPAILVESCPTPGLAVSEAGIYWTCSPSGGVEHDVPTGVYSAPLSAPLGGGTPVLLSTAGLEDPVGLALDATSIYVGDNYAVMKLPIQGGAAEELALGSGSRRVRVDDTHVYWTNADASSVRKVPIGGGASVALATGYFESHEVALDATHVYWTTPGEGPSVGSVNKVPKEGGTPVALATGQPSPYYIALDKAHVYWVNAGAGEIRRVPVGGGESAVVISGVAPNDLAVDSTSIYWTDRRGVVMKLAK